MMRQVVESLMQRVTDEAEYPCYFNEVEETPQYPYVLLWCTPGALDSVTLSGVSDLDESLGVTMVATSSIGVLAMASWVRQALYGFRPAADGWHMSPLSDPYDSRSIQVDRDVSLPGSGFPSFAVDLYSLAGTRR